MHGRQDFEINFENIDNSGKDLVIILKIAL